jgi:hypothetical protein
MKRTHTNETSPAAPAAAFSNEPVYGFGPDILPVRDVLGRMAGTKVYSERTSSLPLAQFLLPSPELDRLLERLILFCNRDDDLDPADVARHLEYPVYARDPRTGRPIEGALSSMSDAMLLAPGFRVAVEGKWTEPIKHPYESVRQWLAKGFNPAVLDAWLGYLAKAGAIRAGLGRDAFLDVPYQLVHRAASACRGVVPGSHVRPAVCYVVFRDADAAPEDAEKTRAFEESLLGPWTEWVDAETLEFDLVRVPILRIPPPLRGRAAARLFLEMADGARPYAFDWPAVTLRRLTSSGRFA